MINLKNLFSKILGKMGYSISRKAIYKSNLDDLQRISKEYNNHQIVKLHFGCGPRVLKGWLNIDLFYEPYQNYLQYYTNKHYPENLRGSIKDFYAINFLESGIPLPNESVDVIFHEDFFEHLTQKEQMIFLAESLRVLKKGGVHRINTPNLVASMRDNSDFKKGKSGVYIEEWDNWHHLSIVSPEILKNMSDIVGYTSIYFNSKNESIIAKDLPLEYRPDEKDRPAKDSNVFADLIK